MLNPHCTLPELFVPRLLTALAVWFTMAGSIRNIQAADESTKLTSAMDFRSILQKHTEIAFADIAKYVRENPDAPDSAKAHAWLFQAALEHQLEIKATAIAEAYLKHAAAHPEVLPLARQVLCLGLIESGKIDAALVVFEGYLQSIRFRAPADAITFSFVLASRTQVANQFAATRKIYDALSTKFFLNAQIREMCDIRLAKLELIGKAAPDIGVGDLSGKNVDLSDYQGKVVLIDFWSTNCPPCLEEFPSMKQLYAEYHEKGFEIVGISLDDSADVVDTFQKRWKLPWRIVLNGSKFSALRERYKAVKIPSLFLIDAKGKVSHFDVRGNDLRRVVELSLGIGKKPS